MFGRLKIFRTFEVQNIIICIKTDTTFYGYKFKPSHVRLMSSPLQVIRFCSSHKFMRGRFFVTNFLNYKIQNLFKKSCSVNNSSDTATITDYHLIDFLDLMKAQSLATAINSFSLNLLESENLTNEDYKKIEAIFFQSSILLDILQPDQLECITKINTPPTFKN